MATGSALESLLFAASAYGLGQVANMVFQLRLLDRLGPLQYGEIGLVHLLLVTLIFVADMGYSSLFLRETTGSPGWQHDWRCALGHKLTASLVLLFMVTCGWQLWGGAGASREYLFWAAPGCLFAAFNYSSPMIAEGRRLGGLLVTQITWPSALLVWCLLPERAGLSMAAGAGLSFSLGYLLQAIVSVVCSRQPGSWLPLAGRGQISAALPLSMISLCGALHDRLTPFLVAPLAPAFLPLLLILNHVLSGLGGIQAQLSRLLLPGADTSAGRARILGMASLLIWATILVLLGAHLIQNLPPFAQQRSWLQWTAILVLAWSVSASSGLLITLLISERRERPLLKLILVGMAGSALLQIGAAYCGDAGYLLWARLAGALAMTAWVMKMLALRPGPWGWFALSLSLLACVTAQMNANMAVCAALLLPTLIALMRNRPCYIPTLRARTLP